MPSPSLVSVIIPCYNYAAFLPQAVDSVLRQRGPEVEVEIIVVDDGSTDDTPAVAERLGSNIRYIRQENSGPSGARNAGLRVASGDFAAFLDADDLFTAGLLRSHLRIFEAQPNLDMTISRCMDVQQQADGKHLTLWALVKSHWHVHACAGNLAPVHCFLTRMECLRRVGFFDETLHHCEDQEYWLRCYGLGAKVRINTDGIVLYRKHGDNTTRNLASMYVGDSLMQVKVADMLANLPDFSAADKCAGWLAHAYGCLQSATWLIGHDAARSLTMQEYFVRASLNAAPLFRQRPMGEGADQVLRIRQYYAGRCLLFIKEGRLQPTPMAVKALGVLERMFPTFAEVPAAALYARLNHIYAELCVAGLPPQVAVD